MEQRSNGGQVIDAKAFERAKGIFAGHSTVMPSDAVQALASEVIMRLSQRSPVSEALRKDIEARATDARIDALCHALLGEDEREATEIVMEAHTAGASVEDLYLDYLAEAARRLGQWWEEDKVASVEVVIGAGRIYAIMRGLRRLFGPGTVRGQGYRAVFASVPGETHVLGVAMAADLLTMHGWEIDLRAGLDHDTLVHEIGLNNYPIIGLSAGTNRMLFPLARLIVALRVSNPSAWILVSGPITELEPDVVRLVDADASAHDLTEAEAMMEDFVLNLQRHSGR